MFVDWLTAWIQAVHGDNTSMPSEMTFNSTFRIGHTRLSIYSLDRQPRHWKMVQSIVAPFKPVKGYVRGQNVEKLTMREFCRGHRPILKMR